MGLRISAWVGKVDGIFGFSWHWISSNSPPPGLKFACLNWNFVFIEKTLNFEVAEIVTE